MPPERPPEAATRRHRHNRAGYLSGWRAPAPQMICQPLPLYPQPFGGLAKPPRPAALLLCPQSARQRQQPATTHTNPQRVGKAPPGRPAATTATALVIPMGGGTSPRPDLAPVGNLSASTPTTGVYFFVCARVPGTPTFPSLLHARGKKLGLGFVGARFCRVFGLLFWLVFGCILLKIPPAVTKSVNPQRG